MGNLHWPVYNESHHDVHISDVLLQVWIRQIQLCGPVGNITTKTLFPQAKCVNSSLKTDINLVTVRTKHVCRK